MPSLSFGHIDLVIPLLPTDNGTFKHQLQTIAGEYSQEWPEIGFAEPDWVFFECYCGEDQEGHSDEGEDGGNAEHVIVGTLSTMDFPSSRERSVPLRQEGKLNVFELRIERIARELWVGGDPLEDEDGELLFEQTYSASSM
jgi:hypothetical protein